MKIEKKLDEIWSEFLKPVDEKVLYGKYQKPETLIKLEKLSKQSAVDLESLGFYIDKNTIPFAPQPIDMIPFASTGTDGTFFAFLSDFGSVKNLEEAPIVMYCGADINSENTSGYCLFSKNITDFLTICIQIGNPYLIYESDPTEINFNEAFDEFLEDEVDDLTIFNKTRETLKSAFKLKEFTDLNQYYINFYKNRNESINIKTKDGLGIQFKIENYKNTTIKSFNVSLLQKEDLTIFLEKQTKYSRLKFYRDYGVIYQELYKSDFFT